MSRDHVERKHDVNDHVAVTAGSQGDGRRGKGEKHGGGNELFQAQGWAEVVEDISKNGA